MECFYSLIRLVLIDPYIDRFTLPEPGDRTEVSFVPPHSPLWSSGGPPTPRFCPGLLTPPPLSPGAPWDSVPESREDGGKGQMGLSREATKPGDLGPGGGTGDQFSQLFSTRHLPPVPTENSTSEMWESQGHDVTHATALCHRHHRWQQLVSMCWGDFLG